MNDELHSSNTELRDRTSEVSRLNAFMTSILSGLRAAVVVLAADLRVLVWNRRAEELWGVRQDEVVGSPLLNLDIGLPVERLRPLIRAVLVGGPAAEGGQTDRQVELMAVNRRGKQVRVRITASPLADPGLPEDEAAGGRAARPEDVAARDAARGAHRPGVILVIEPVAGADGP